MRRVELSAAAQAEVWAARDRGEALSRVARRLGVPPEPVRALVNGRGGIRPARAPRAARVLTVAEREEISRGVAVGESFRAIGARLGRPHTTISREVAQNGGRTHYRAADAEAAARRRAARPKPAVLATRPALRRVVEAKLAARWSPEQIARWLRRQYPAAPEMQVSHETIYRSLFVQGRGALRAALTRELRTRRATRQPRTPKQPTGRGQLRDVVPISARPAEAADRAVPGHWEGDLLLGKGGSAIATLVERSTRYVLLARLPAGKTAAAVRPVLARAIRRLPAHLARSLTWDQGKEMAEHARFTVQSGVQVYFCDPHSPWQRGSNENTNGLLRQYFPKGTDVGAHSQRALDRVAAELNGRPRETLGWRAPAEAFAAFERQHATDAA